MKVIRAEEAAGIVADEIRRLMREDDEHGNDCVIVVGMEAVCWQARKELGMKRFAIELGESDVESSTKKQICTIASQAFGRIFACAMNGRFCGIKSSYVPNPREDDKDNRRGCIGFDVAKRSGLFHKRNKRWVRYFVSIQLPGATDEFNESLAARGSRVLMKVAERRMLESVHETESKGIEPSYSGAKVADAVSMIVSK